MLFPNHLIGGAVITGTAAALCGENILATKINIIATLFFSILPDIDNPKSPISKIPYLTEPISRMIFTRFGHRTITHSVWALIVVTAFFALCGLSPVIVGFAYFSHLLLDMATLQGVPLFFPFVKNPVVIPANPRHRFRTGDTKTEFVMFGIFSGLTVFSMPLMENGFWTSYNSSMGTPKHLHSEFIKSTDLIEATYKIQSGSEMLYHKGYIIQCTETKATIFDGHKLRDIDSDKDIVKSVSFVHTGKKFYIQNQQFFNINSDSLNKLIHRFKILEINILANKEFTIVESGIPATRRDFKAHNVESVILQSLDTETLKDSFGIMPNFQAAAIEESLKSLRGEYAEKLRGYNDSRTRLNSLKISILSEADPLARERMMKERDELERLESPKFDHFRESELNLALATARERYALENEQRRQASEKEYRERLEKNPKTAFTGSLKYFTFD
jgi:inner membrane protein